MTEVLKNDDTYKVTIRYDKNIDKYVLFGKNKISKRFRVMHLDTWKPSKMENLIEDLVKDI